MKIALTGSACTGKTTLAEKLANELGLPLIEENYGPLFDPLKPFKKEEPKLFINALKDVMEAKHKQEQEHVSFVTDRCPVDLMNIWLTRGLSSKRRRSAEFYQHCRSLTKQYDYLIIPPWGVLPVESKESEKGRQVRVKNPWILLHNHAAIVGLARQWLPGERIITIRPSMKKLEDRVDYVLQRLGSKLVKH